MAIQTLLIAIAMAALLMSAGMALAWIIQQRTGQSGWVDACWTFSVGLACVTIALAAAHGSAQSERALLVAALIAFWSLRLGVHIVVRTRGSGDDPRYAKMREEWGDEAPRRMFTLLQLQAVASLPLLLSVAVAASNSTRALGLQDLVAVLIFLGGIAGEGLSDALRGDPLPRRRGMEGHRSRQRLALIRPRVAGGEEGADTWSGRSS